MCSQEQKNVIKISLFIINKLFDQIIKTYFMEFIWLNPHETKGTLLRLVESWSQLPFYSFELWKRTFARTDG